MSNNFEWMRRNGTDAASTGMSHGKKQFKMPVTPFPDEPDLIESKNAYSSLEWPQSAGTQQVREFPLSLPVTPSPNLPAAFGSGGVSQFKAPYVSRMGRGPAPSPEAYSTQKVQVPHGVRTGIGTIEEYSTALIPSFKKPPSLLVKIGLYSLCILVSCCGIAIGLFLIHVFYLSSSILVYIDVFCIIGILLSTLFASAMRFMRQESQWTHPFKFRQPRSSSSSLKKMGEFLFYILAWCCTLYILFASTFAPQKTVYSLLVSLVLGFGYMIFLKPGMAKWIVWMAISPWYRIKKAEQPPSALVYHPFVSVIIPAWNEEVGILSTMRSILSSQYSPLELIVINDGSTDTSDKKIRSFIREHYADFPGKTIVYRYQPNAGKSSALNRGIQLARGEIIITTDADCVMHPMCVTHLVASFSDSEVMGATGDYRVGNVRSLLGRIQAIEYAIGFYTRKADSLFGTVFVMSGTVSAFRRAAFERIGLFHTENITEDLEITMRMHKGGMKIVSEPRAIVYTESPNKVSDLFRQRLRWVRGTLDAFGEHSDFLFSRKREHGKIHSWVVLPLIRLNHFAVLIQILCKYAMLIFCIATHQYATLAIASLLITIIVSISVLADTDYWETSLLSPIAWILLEVPNCIYAVAFLIAWWNYLRRKRQTWQRWNRQGILV